jgi:hypothetical protein
MIARRGHCPTYLEYIIKNALLPRAGRPTPEFRRLTEYAVAWVEIPNYQRGLVWDDEKFEELLDSQSVFLGNAIFGQFSIPHRNAPYNELPATAKDYEILIDGLQRFSIGTALLSVLHTLVFNDPPTDPAAAPHFAALKMNAVQFSPIYEHNDNELQNHPRKAVQDSYKAFRIILGNWITSELNGNAAAIAPKILRLFLTRQIAPDSYLGFPNPYEVTSTFIGLNTVRVQLNIVDWLRSILIERGSASGWTPIEVESVENRFTEIFAGKNLIDPERELMPFAAIIKDALGGDNPIVQTQVFPSWAIGLLRSEVEAFLTFVETVFDSSANPYFTEIRATGAIPFAGCLCYYYRQYVGSGALPTFVTGGTSEDGELHDFLKANYRALFDGRIGRTRTHSERLLASPNYSLKDAGNAISRECFGHDLATPVDRDWAVAALKKADHKRAQRIFNACLLPAMRGGSFLPLKFGKEATQYQIDHLIADSAILANQAGEPEAQSIANFAPLRRTANNRQTNLACSQKLNTGGSYANECILDKTVHPYVLWLVTNQARFGSQLDIQSLLQSGSNPPIAQQRIEWLADQLVPLI